MGHRFLEDSRGLREVAKARERVGPRVAKRGVVHGAFTEWRDGFCSFAVLVKAKIGGAQHRTRRGVGRIACQDLRKSADTFLIILHAKSGDAEGTQPTRDGGGPTARPPPIEPGRK